MTTTRAQVAVVTGASSGIGREAAKALAAQGWRVIGLGRDPERCAAAQAEIRAASTGQEVDMIIADLAVMADAARAAREVAALTDHVDALLNNAGGAPKEKVVTAEGNEATFAGNHLGHFLLTDRLLPLLRAAVAERPAGAVRVLNVSSLGHQASRGLDWNDLQMLANFHPGAAYCNAKLANILFTRALAKRVAADGIVTHAMHPGMVDSNFAARADETMRLHFEAKKELTITPQEAADTLIWLATAAEPGLTSGGYFHQRAPAEVSALGQDEQAAERLWRESEALVASTGV